MSSQVIKLLGLHLATLCFFVLCVISGEATTRSVFTFLAGLLVWPLIGTAKDLFTQMRTEIDEN